MSVLIFYFKLSSKEKNMKVKTNLLLTAGAIILWLTGCGVTTQDQGLGNAANNVSGVSFM